MQLTPDEQSTQEAARIAELQRRRNEALIELAALRLARAGKPIAGAYPRTGADDWEIFVPGGNFALTGVQFHANGTMRHFPAYLEERMAA